MNRHHEMHLEGPRETFAPDYSNSGEGQARRKSRDISIFSRTFNRKVTYFPPGNLKQNEKGMMPEVLGTIVQIVYHERFGFIRVDSDSAPKHGKRKGLYFNFDNVRNVGTKDLSIGVGHKVGLVLDDKNDDDIPRILLVFIDDNSQCKVQENPRQSDRDKRYGFHNAGFNKKTYRRNGYTLAVVTDVNSKKDGMYLTVKNSDSKLFMHADKVTLFSLPLKPEDEVACVVRDYDRNFVQRAKIEKYSSQRRLKEYLDYFDGLTSSISASKQALLEIFDLIPLWEHLGNVSFLAMDERDEFIFSLLKLVTHIFKCNTKDEIMITKVVETLFKTDFLGNVRKTVEENHNHLDKVHVLVEFCQCCMAAVPQFGPKLNPLFSVIARGGSRNVIANLFEEFLSRISFLSGKTDSSNWKSLPMVLTEEEILGDLISKDKYLRKVQTNQAYASEEEYMDTYFRLLRAECFHSIQQGIKDLLAGASSDKEFHCYYNIHLADIDDDSIAFSIQFTRVRPIKSYQFKSGNLLCLSPNNRFDKVIWATVSSRNEDMLDKSCAVFVEFCDFNRMSLGEIVTCLQVYGGRTVMVEAKSNFQSLQPVLNALRKKDMSKLSLKEEIVKVKQSSEKPEYKKCLEDAIRIENVHNPFLLSSRISIDDDMETTEKNVAKKIAKISKELDRSQLEAFNFALDNRLSLIQGPPGCGKTYLGVKLVELLLEYQLEKPILVMTYKNHALDEFLKHAAELDNCSLDEIVRIGFGSKEQKLQERNLAKIRTDGWTSNTWDKMREINDSIQSLQSIIKENVTALQWQSSLMDMDILTSLSDAQLENLLLACPWSKDAALTYKIDDKSVATNCWIGNELVPQIVAKYESLSNFVRVWRDDNFPEQDDLAALVGHLKKLLLMALRSWLPSKSELKKLQELQECFLSELRNDIIDKESDEYTMDQTCVQAMQLLTCGKTQEQWNEPRFQGAQNFKRQKKLDEVIFNLSDFPTCMSPATPLLGVTNIWGLSDTKRSQFLYTVLHNFREKPLLEMTEHFEMLKAAQAKKKMFEHSIDVQTLQKMKIVGVTITGASNHHDVLQEVAPSIIIVEEAAEILEPSLLAAFNPKVQHVILIGDHKQLPPQVDTFLLERNFKLHTSMMERLINSGFPYRALKKQSRMRTEFSHMLKDIYPDLEDNWARIANNKSPECISSPMFFWGHNHMESAAGTHERKEEEEEEDGRSKCNVKEPKW